MKAKRKISGIIALCMALSVFAGCQQKVDEDMVLPPPPETSAESTETTPEITEAPTETTTEITTTEETDIIPEETTETATEETTRETEETSETAAAWSETEMTAVMYITENCYSRERAIIGSTPISQHYVGDSVEVVAITDTGYYKLATGGFIHSDYVSERKPVVTTAPPATEPPVTESASVTAPPVNPPDTDTTQGGSFVNPGIVSTGKYNIASSSRYAYKQLTASEQTFYNDVVAAAKSFDSAIAIPAGMTKDDVVKVYAIVANNEPQLFWLGTSISAGTSYATISFKTTDPAEIASMQAEIDAAASAILAKAANYSGTISKLKVFYDHLVLNNEFSMSEGGYNGTIYNGLTGKGNLQCAGYAKTMMYLCDMAGIECCMVAGTNEEGDSHAWNVVYCQNGYYNIDATWGDPINRFDSSFIQYEFFLVPDAWIHNITHYNVSKIIRSNGNVVKMYDPPACTKEGCNYFAAYNKVYSTYEEADAALKADFDAQIAAGKNVVELRVTDKAVYDRMMTDDAYREYQNYAKSKSDKVERIQRQKSLTGGVQVVHYDVIYK